MQAALAAGFPATAALSMTPEDVKAADSDQVTIPFDTEGNYKIQVNAADYDHFMRAKGIRDDIESEFREREGIIGISLRGGLGKNYVQVNLDPENSAKEERRGELPERRNDVRIEPKEEDPSPNLSHKNSDDECVRHRNCDIEMMDPTTRDTLPGGLISRQFNTARECTNGPRFINGGDHTFAFGWSISAHCIRCGDGEGTIIEHDDDAIGTLDDIYADVALIDRNRDIAYLEPAGTTPDPVSEIVHPADHSDTIHISGTVAESSMGTIQNNNDYPVDIRGISHCETSGGTLTAHDQTYENGDPHYTCVDWFWDCYEVNTGSDHTYPGDSGAVPYVQGPEGNYFAIGTLTGGVCNSNDNFYVGGQGYTIRNEYNIWWDDL